MSLTPSACRKSHPPPGRLFFHGAVWPTLLSTRHARQTAHVDPRSHQHACKFRPRICGLAEGELGFAGSASSGGVCTSQTHIGARVLFPTVLSGKEAEDDLVSAARDQEDAEEDLNNLFSSLTTSTTLAQLHWMDNKVGGGQHEFKNLI